MKPIVEMNIGELAAYVCSHLAKQGIEVVLSGGACVSIYSKNSYRSFDLDFIDRGATPRRRLKKTLELIGFKEHQRYFRHPDTEYFLEFPSGPLAVGSQPVAEVSEMKLSSGLLRLLSPTDCVKDRLAAYYHWHDQQALEQAMLVAKQRPINLAELRRWSRNEGMAEEFKKIYGVLAAVKREKGKR